MVQSQVLKTLVIYHNCPIMLPLDCRLKQRAELMVLSLLLCADPSTLVPTKTASTACCSAETCPSMLAECWSAVSARLHLTSSLGAKQHVGADIILTSALHCVEQCVDTAVSRHLM